MNDRTLGYRPALDGIRALAVVGVLVYHLDLPWVTGGFLGVDVFFVLSGYLITSLLVTEWEQWGSFDVVAFYVRRARRLLPALFLVVIAVATWAALVETPDKLGGIRDDGLASLLYTANWRFILVRQSYFDQYGDPSPFRHMWSLAIEEQFYLLFPLVLGGLLLCWRGRRGRVAVTLGVLALLSAAAMAWLYTPGTDPSRVYFGTDTRIFELLIGCVLALVMLDRRRGSAARRAAAVIGPAALIGLVFSFLIADDQADALYRGGFVLVCLAAAALIAAVEVAPSTRSARALSWAPVRWVGVISYGLYLWHWPVFVAISAQHTSLEGAGLVTARLGVTLLLAGLSYALVERPVRTGSLFRHLPPVLRRITVAAAFPVSLAVLIAGTWSASPPQLVASPFGPTSVAGHGDRTILVVGDSVGLSLAANFPTTRYPEWKVVSSVQTGCGLAVQYLAVDGRRGVYNRACDGSLERWSQAVRQQHPAAVVLSLGAWEVVDHVVGGRVLSATGARYARYLSSRLEQVRRLLTAGGAHLFVTDVPCYRDTGQSVGPLEYAGVRDDPARGAAVNSTLRAFVSRHGADTSLLPMDSWLCPNGRYTPTVDGQVVRYDGVHFSKAGAAIAWSLIMPAVRAATDGGTKRILLIGDSVPYGLAQHFPRRTYPHYSAQSLTALGCNQFQDPEVVDGRALDVPAVCAQYERLLPSSVTKSAPAVALVFLGIGEQFDKLVNGSVLRLGTPAYARWLDRELDLRVALLRAQDVPVVLVNVPCHDVEFADSNASSQVTNDAHRLDELNALVTDYVAAHQGVVAMIDLHGYLCPHGYTNSAPGVSRLRSDGLHFTAAGAAYVWRYLMPRVRPLIAARRTG